jgi:hypothetical protein
MPYEEAVGDMGTAQWLTSMCEAATRKEMSDAKLPLQYRDSCANLLIPLNKCRVQNYYMPWTCVVRSPSQQPLQIRIVAERGRTQANVKRRTSDTATKSASTRSSSCGCRRWTSLGRRRVVRGVTRVGGRLWSGVMRWDVCYCTYYKRKEGKFPPLASGRAGDDILLPRNLLCRSLLTQYARLQSLH